MNAWGVCVFLAGIAVLVCGLGCAKLRGVPRATIEGLWPWLLAGGFAGAHLYWLFAVEGWPAAKIPASELFNPFAGTAVQGGILGGILAGWAYLTLKRQAILPVFDALAPGGALAQGIARIGCFIAGCCYGRKTELFSPLGLHAHPAQLYETILDFALAVFLYRYLRSRPGGGKVFALYLAGASAIRFLVQFSRDDDGGRLVFGLAHSQFLCVPMFLVALMMYSGIRKRGSLWQSS